MNVLQLKKEELISPVLKMKIISENLTMDVVTDSSTAQINGLKRMEWAYEYLMEMTDDFLLLLQKDMEGIKNAAEELTAEDERLYQVLRKAGEEE